MSRWSSFCVVVCVVLLLSGGVTRFASAGVIDTYPLPSNNVIGTVGEVSATNPYIHIDSYNSFATYLGQTFVALPGLAQDFTFRLAQGGGTDGIDFRVLIAETAYSDGLYTPTNIVYQSPLLTFGNQLGASGISVAAPGVTKADVTVNLGGLDLVDGRKYAWVLNTVSSADGIEGFGDVYGHGPQASVFGNMSELVWDLKLNRVAGAWNNVADVDLMFRLVFSDGGVIDPLLPSLGTLPAGDLSVPIPGSFVMMLSGLGLLAVAAQRRRKHGISAAC